MGVSTALSYPHCNVAGNNAKGIGPRVQFLPQFTLELRTIHTNPTRAF
jgi:hypothetical protein